MKNLAPVATLAQQRTLVHETRAKITYAPVRLHAEIGGPWFMYDIEDVINLSHK